MPDHAYTKINRILAIGEPGEIRKGLNLARDEIALPAGLTLEAAQSPDAESRGTSTLAIGKFAESIPPSWFADDLRRGFVGPLCRNFADPKHGIRARAVRSPGKLAKHGHLTEDEQRAFKSACLLRLQGKTRISSGTGRISSGKRPRKF
jgi:hypothetical protein